MKCSCNDTAHRAASLGRKRHSGEESRDPINPSHMSDNTIHVFDQFRAEIDDHNDRRERLIKVATIQCLVTFSTPPDKSRCHHSLKESHILVASFNAR